MWSVIRAESGCWKITEPRSPKYLNNMIEQVHRRVMSRTTPMLGFKGFEHAAVAIAGVELPHRIRAVPFVKFRGQARNLRQSRICHVVQRSEC